MPLHFLYQPVQALGAIQLEAVRQRFAAYAGPRAYTQMLQRPSYAVGVAELFQQVRCHFFSHSHCALMPCSAAG
jgi:hypothetical protein